MDMSLMASNSDTGYTREYLYLLLISNRDNPLDVGYEIPVKD